MFAISIARSSAIINELHPAIQSNILPITGCWNGDQDRLTVMALSEAFYQTNPHYSVVVHDVPSRGLQPDNKTPGPVCQNPVDDYPELDPLMRASLTGVSK